MERIYVSRRAIMLATFAAPVALATRAQSATLFVPTLISSLFGSPGGHFSNGVADIGPGTLPTAIGNGALGTNGQVVNQYGNSTLNNLPGPSSRLFGSMVFHPVSNPVGAGMGDQGTPMHLLTVIDVATQLIMLSLELYPPGVFQLLANQSVLRVDYPVVSLYLANPRTGMNVFQTWYFPMKVSPLAKDNLLRYSANPYNNPDGTQGYTIGMTHNQNGKPTMWLPSYYGPNGGFGGSPPTVFSVPWGVTGQGLSNAPAAAVVGAQPTPGVMPEPGDPLWNEIQDGGFNGYMWSPLTLYPGYSTSPVATDPYFIQTDPLTGNTQMITPSPSGNNFLGSGSAPPVYLGGNDGNFGGSNGDPYAAPHGDSLTIDPSWTGVPGWGAPDAIPADQSSPYVAPANDNGDQIKNNNGNRIRSYKGDEPDIPVPRGGRIYKISYEEWKLRDNAFRKKMRKKGYLFGP